MNQAEYCQKIVFIFLIMCIYIWCLDARINLSSWVQRSEDDTYTYVAKLFQYSEYMIKRGKSQVFVYVM